jgi:hypothetical protein
LKEGKKPLTAGLMSSIKIAPAVQEKRVGTARDPDRADESVPGEGLPQFPIIPNPMTRRSVAWSVVGKSIEGE